MPQRMPQVMGTRFILTSPGVVRCFQGRGQRPTLGLSYPVPLGSLPISATDLDTFAAVDGCLMVQRASVGGPWSPLTCTPSLCSGQHKHTHTGVWPSHLRRAWGGRTARWGSLWGSGILSKRHAFSWTLSSIWQNRGSREWRWSAAGWKHWQFRQVQPWLCRQEE